MADVLETGAVIGVGMLAPKLIGVADTVHDGENCADTMKVAVSAPAAAWLTITQPAATQQVRRYLIERFMSDHRDKGEHSNPTGPVRTKQIDGSAATTQLAGAHNFDLADPKT